MFARSCYAAACSAFGDLTESEWYGHNLLCLGTSVRRISYGTGPRKYDFLTEAHKPFNMLGKFSGSKQEFPKCRFKCVTDWQTGTGNMIV
jgi:hypothetical protein